MNRSLRIANHERPEALPRRAPTFVLPGRKGTDPCTDAFMPESDPPGNGAFMSKPESMDVFMPKPDDP